MAFPPFGDHSFLEIRHMSGSGFGDAVPRIRRVKDTLGIREVGSDCNPDAMRREAAWRDPVNGPCCMDHPEGCLIMVFFNTGDNLDAT